MNRTKHLFITLLALAAAFVVAAQLTTDKAAAQSVGTWVAQTSGTTNELRSIHFINEMEGWAAGANATLLKTTNGGTTWSAVNTGVDPIKGFNYVRFLTRTTGFVGGEKALARTLDAGAAWTLGTGLLNTDLIASFFPLSAGQVWAAGKNESGTIDFLILNGFGDNGNLSLDAFTFATNSNPGSNDGYRDISFFGTAPGWIVGGAGRIIQWTNDRFRPSILQTSGTSQTLNGIQMLTVSRGWVVGNNGMILTTNDGGGTWTARTSGTTVNLRDVHFVDANRGWAVGDRGVILTSSDGGTTWGREETGITTDLRSVHFVSASVGFIVGANGAILRRLDMAPATSVSGASYVVGLAAEAIASAFGTTLATMTQSAPSMQLPTTLAGTTVKVKDSAGDTRDASLFYVSPTQINYLLPADTKPGLATVTATNGNGSMALGAIEVFTVAPGFFTANQDGKGAPSGYAIHVPPTGAQRRESLAQFDATTMKYVPAPIDLGPENEMVMIELYGTGLRQRSTPSAVTATIGGVPAMVDYAGKHSMYVGLDQVNLKVPRSLGGRGEVDVVVTVDGKVASTLRIHIR